MARIYISSTYGDLREYRDLVYRTLRQMRHDVVAMEDYVAIDVRPLERCLADVETCDLYIGIIAWRYGYCPEQPSVVKKSITELEFRHAVAKSKPLLMFLLAEDSPWPHVQMEKGEGALRLQAFRSELMANYTVSFFSSKEDLARLVSASVYNWSSEGHHSSSLEQVIQHEPNLGNFAFKICNRKRQLSQFVDFFLYHLNHSAGMPQVYLIQGQEKECHDSLVERLVHTQIRPLSEKKWGEHRTVVTVKKLGWSYEGELAEIQQDLKRSLFLEFDSTYLEEDLSASALCDLLLRSLKHVVVLHHWIDVSRWDSTLRDSIRWYLSYWAGVSKSTRLQFVLFLSLVLPEPKSAPWWKDLLPIRGLDEKLIEREFQEIADSSEGLACRRLSSLLPVKRGDVKEWFRFNGIHTEKQRYELLDRIFSGQDGKMLESKSMADVEHDLQTIMKSSQSRFLRVRGHND